MAGEITISISGISDLIGALDEIKARVDDATQRATAQSGELLVNTVKASFVGSHAPGEWHVGGPTPNVVTGNLKRSVRSGPVTAESTGRYSVQVGPTAVYARIQEKGGRISAHGEGFLMWAGRRTNGTTGFIRKKSVMIPARPYFAPSFELAKTRIADVFRSAWSQAISG